MGLKRKLKDGLNPPAKHRYSLRSKSKCKPFELETFFSKIHCIECRCRISIEISTLKEKKNVLYILQKNEKDNIATSKCDTRSSTQSHYKY